MASPVPRLYSIRGLCRFHDEIGCWTIHFSFFISISMAIEYDVQSKYTLYQISKPGRAIKKLKAPPKAEACLVVGLMDCQPPFWLFSVSRSHLRENVEVVEHPLFSLPCHPSILLPPIFAPSYPILPHCPIIRDKATIPLVPSFAISPSCTLGVWRGMVTVHLLIFSSTYEGGTSGRKQQE